MDVLNTVDGVNNYDLFTEIRSILELLDTKI